MSRRSPWMDAKTALLIGLLDERYGVTITEDIAREDIEYHLHLVAEKMHIKRQAAKPYVTDDGVAALASRIANVRGAHNVVDLNARRFQRRLPGAGSPVR
jgi:predicted metal-dependent phosphotriesterase family hydrolase